MKELSIEEKAKRYDEALERAKDFMNGEVHYALKRGENIMCWIFPELKESEDDRIRKELLEFLDELSKLGKNTNFDRWSKSDCADWIIWLEKQGETYTKKDIDNAYLEGMAFAKDELEKQNKQILANSAKTCKDEQKPTDKEMKTLLRTEYEKGRADAIAEMQSPAWSEDDEKTRNRIISALNHLIEVENVIGFELLDSDISWLESLKERVQPKQEWSEEDESYLNTTIAYLKDAKEFKKTADNCINWLKSLKPQNHWKPTEAQLASLRIACDRNDRVGFDLTQLLKELKEL